LLGNRALPVLLYFERGTDLTGVAAGAREARDAVEGHDAGPGRLEDHV